MGKLTEASEASSANIQLETEHVDRQLIHTTSVNRQIELADRHAKRKIELDNRQNEHADGKIEQNNEHTPAYRLGVAHFSMLQALEILIFSYLLFCVLTGIRLWVHICNHLYFELCDCLKTFPIFVPSQCLIARNVCELLSFNRGLSHLNKARRIDDVSRGSLSCYEILTNN